MDKAFQFLRLDLRTIAQYLTVKQLGLYAVIILTLSFTLKNPAFLVGMIMMYGLFYTAYPFAIGEKTQADILYASLPINKGQIVLGRYLFALWINLVTGVLAALLTFVTSLLLGQPFDGPSCGVAVISCFFLFTIVEFIQFPIYFKMGYTKAKIIALLPVLLLPFSVAALGSIVPEELWKPAFFDFAFWVEQHPIAALLRVLVVWAVLLLISIYVSYRNYEKREF
jgi:hypothetical protein